MLSLKEENLEAFQYLHDRDFTGSLRGRSHLMIPMDQIIEMTINQSCRENNGLSGKTEKIGASERWAKIHHHMVAIHKHLNEKVQKNTKDDERDVQMILKYLKNWTPNMWHSDQPVSNIATGKIATEAISKNTLSLKERGHQAMSEFIGRITLPEDTTTGKSYYAPIKKQAVNLFKEGNTKKKCSIPEDEGQSFANILSIFDKKSLDLHNIMKWPVTRKS